MLKNSPENRRLTVGVNIKRLREKKSLTQEALSEKIDVHVSYIGQIERGLRYPSLKVLFSVADALEVRISNLFKGIDGKKSE